MRDPSVLNTSWVRYRSACYLRGRGLSFACGPDPIFPAPALDREKFSISVDTVRYEGLQVCDSRLDVFAKDSMDHIFCGPRIQTFSDTQEVFRLLTERLKIGGHLIIHSVQDLDPKDVMAMLGSFAGWREKDCYNRDGMFLGIFKLLGRKAATVLPKTPRSGAKRVCIARYGAIGDAILLTPLIKKLHEDGYEVTLNATPYGADVLKHNPYIKNVVLQERDIIPNQELGGYWQEWMTEYDKYINLSESIEGKLLKVERRNDFYTTKDWRMETCGVVNYYDQTMRLGGYPEVTGTRGELFFSRDEQKNVAYVRSKLKDKFLMVWALRGSSFHKVYPLLQPVLTEWLKTHPDVEVFLTGSERDKPLEFQHPQVRCTAGEIPIREVFAMTTIADLVVGPESAVINAASCFDRPKIVFLSHSNEHNLCAYWTNYTALKPENVLCFPCHQLHYSLDSCVQVTIQDTVTDKPIWSGPRCAGAGVSPERVIEALDSVYNKWKTRLTKEQNSLDKLSVNSKS